ncbi:PucR family transcriptional regulator [Streptomyces violaceusniger]|uniref:PucR family transcriptional regulator ligand-binding domain-containing protein n=3 Tax=Streptomyces TaxID=1883 RepID=A0ABD5J3K5_9ACTN|nr:PucR family transcriptional regulator [Streptomyces violaceusniger]KUL65281.1 PucR family transcriptional regulator [Streptomyces violaceusniger]MEE4582923.1 PucR family transcriptional regulator ligand-binding domain-containing protein [Streptomyces sp. DSM 41602]WTA85977.1 PucR family transcriptional regulator ligand-binding domain-containing protein [Streptomyces antimycoticus]WTB03464.1 PucR family transcriptional regulator ligand-binding domain-containing protein [Streptomyces antimycot
MNGSGGTAYDAAGGPASRPAGPPRVPGRSPLSLADVLRLPVLAAGVPEVVSGHGQLSRPVRWVHVTELLDPASFLKGGELVLTTGMPLPEDPALVRRYVDELADIGAAGLVIELVRRYHRPPSELVRACLARDFPLVLLSRTVNFVEVTQVLHSLIVGSQVESLRRAQDVHDTFTALTLRGAGPEEVVDMAAEMSGHPVVLENLVHQAVICGSPGRGVEGALTGWERRSRATPSPDRTGLSGPEDWLVTAVEYRGERWGRLLMLPDGSGHSAVGPEDAMVLERTATALTIARLTHHTRWERRAQRTLLLDLVEQRCRSMGEARARAEALGVPVAGRRLMVVLVSPGPGAGETTELEDRLTDELGAAGAAVLVGAVPGDHIGVLLALPAATPWRPLVERLSRSVRESRPDAVISVGSEVSELAQTARSFQQAARVADAAVPGTPDKAFHELSDIGLRQLLYALRGDVRLQEFVERQLGRLVDYDERHGTDLLPVLHTFLDAAGNKTVAAKRANLSRQAFYQRLHSIERVLGCDLESGEQRTQLHVALTAFRLLRLSRGPAPS